MRPMTSHEDEAGGASGASAGDAAGGAPQASSSSWPVSVAVGAPAARPASPPLAARAPGTEAAVPCVDGEEAATTLSPGAKGGTAAGTSVAVGESASLGRFAPLLMVCLSL